MFDSDRRALVVIFNPLAPRITFAVLLAWLSAGLIYAGPSWWPLWLLVGLIVIVGGYRCATLRLCLDEKGITVHNLTWSYRYSWEQVAQITLKNYGTFTTVDRQHVTTLPRFLQYGMPAVAFRLTNDRCSAAISATAFLGPKRRQQVLDLLRENARARHIELLIRSPNDGWLFGTMWDMRSGEGIR